MTTKLKTVLLGALIGHLAGSSGSAGEFDFFEAKIRPVLAENCYECHSSKAGSAKGGLYLDSKSGLLTGGNSGPALIPGQPGKSLLIQAMAHSHKKLAMPKKREKLPQQVVQDFTRWIVQGALDPREDREEKVLQVKSQVDLEAGRQFWAFQPVKKVVPPKVSGDWAYNDIDRFVLAKLQGQKLQAVKDADRATLIRRLTFDLTGLPPTVEQIEAFQNDQDLDRDPKAFEKWVDRLLASERYGERWGRHWLDIARYAESVGMTRNYPFPHAWRYRDYVIDAFNHDMPYNQFVLEQLAGDLISSEDDERRNEKLIATGFMAVGSQNLNERDEKVYQMEVVSEQVDTLSRSLLALTVGCARCHDHKFDPVSTHDYYAMAGIFKSSQLLNGYKNKQGGGNKYGGNGMFHTIAPGEEEDGAFAAQAERKNKKEQQRLQALRKEVDELKAQQAAMAKGKGSKDELAKLRKELKTKNKTLAQMQKAVKDNDGPTGPVAMGLRDMAAPADARINIRGDANRLGQEVPRGYPEVLHFAGQKTVDPEMSGRKELAEWLIDPKHPLTARVMVNRVWHHLFGRGLVRTVDNFGITGEPPTHPELLDYLAARFVQEHKWSVKSLIREIVASHAYRLGSDHHEQNYALDPDNEFLWRMNRKRLEAEAIRDAMLLAGGSINLKPLEGSPVANMKVNEIRDGKVEGIGNHRSVYLPIVRDKIPPFLTLFDFPTPSEVKGGRDVTTVAPQALFFMNNPQVIKQAKLLSSNLLNDDALNDQQRIRKMFLSTLGRRPAESEVAGLAAYFDQRMQKKENRELAWSEAAQSLFASAEFRTLK